MDRTRQSVGVRAERHPGGSSRLLGLNLGCIHSKGTQEEGQDCGNPGSLVDGDIFKTCSVRNQGAFRWKWVDLKLKRRLGNLERWPGDSWVDREWLKLWRWPGDSRVDREWLKLWRRVGVRGGDCWVRVESTRRRAEPWDHQYLRDKEEASIQEKELEQKS